MPEADLLHYRLPWLSGAVYPGAHPGRTAGAGLLIERHRPLTANSDPRRIDLRASVLDPYEHYRVRVYRQPSRIDVYLLADLSASMGYAGKPAVVSTLLRTIARSAASYGDRFGFIGADDRIEPERILPAGAPGEAVAGLARRLESAAFAGGATGLQAASAFLPPARALVFLLTDAHVALAELGRLLAALQNHDVVPLVLWAAGEYRDLPDWGLMAVRDLESGVSRTLLMRPALKHKIVSAYDRRKQALLHRFRAFGCEPLFLEKADVPAINRHLSRRAA